MFYILADNASLRFSTAQRRELCRITEIKRLSINPQIKYTHSGYQDQESVLFEYLTQKYPALAIYMFYS